jgi:RAB protein geranylgeranyltransferase component A
VQKEKFQYIKMILDTLVTTYLPVFIVNKLEYLQKEKTKILKSLQNKKQIEPKTQSGLERKKRVFKFLSISSKKVDKWISNNLSPGDFKLFLDAIQDKDIDGLDQKANHLRIPNNF